MKAAAGGRRIVLATFGSPGDIQPFLAIGAELRQRGHVPVIATSAFYRDMVAAENLEFAVIRPDREPGQQDPDYLERVLRWRQTPGQLFRQMFLPGLRDSLGDLLDATASADLVVAHPLVSGARLAAEARRLPWISVVMQPMGYLSAYEPAVIGPSWIAAALRGAGPAATRLTYRAARAITGRWVGDWQALRAELGLPPATDTPLWHAAHSRLVSLGLFPRVLGGPQPDWPPQARVTGFPFYRSPRQALDAELLAFLTAGEPPLVFTLGTTAVNDPGSFYEESAAAASALGLRAVLVMGRGCKPGAPGREGIIAVPYAPHSLIFPHARAVIHQGGIGTLSEALRAGKPMLIMPYAHDQADNAWRASRLGVARVIARRRYRTRHIVQEIERLLGDPHHRLCAARAAADVRRECGARAAADAIEQAWRSAVVDVAGGSEQGCTDTYRAPPLLP